MLRGDFSFTVIENNPQHFCITCFPAVVLAQMTQRNKQFSDHLSLVTRIHSRLMISKVNPVQKKHLKMTSIQHVKRKV